MTYSTEVYVDLKLIRKELAEGYEFIDLPNGGQRKRRKVKRIIEEYPKSRVLIGKIPIMLRSTFCMLNQLNEIERVKNAKDCAYDQGGYFIINGGEKVIVAQEKMAQNTVLVFEKKLVTSKFSWVSEIRS